MGYWQVCTVALQSPLAPKLAISYLKKDEKAGIVVLGYIMRALISQIRPLSGSLTFSEIIGGSYYQEEKKLVIRVQKTLVEVSLTRKSAQNG